MYVSFLFSLALHALLLLLLLIDWAWIGREPADFVAVGSVDVVTPAELARYLPPEAPRIDDDLIIAQANEEPPPSPETPAAPEPAPAPETPPEPPDLAEPLPETRAPVETPSAEPAPEPDPPPPPPEPEPAAPPEPEPAAPPEPEPQPATEPEPAPETEPEVQPEEVAALAPTIRPPQRRPEPPPLPTRPEPEPEPEQDEDPLADLLDRVAGQNVPPAPAAPSLGRPARLSAGQEDAVRQAIRPCWNVDPGATGGTAVLINVIMRSDGMVERAEVADQGRYAADPAFRAAAIRALRAARNQTCQPWPLPRDRWPDWQVIELNFDPQDYF